LLEIAFDSSAQISTIPRIEVHRVVHAILDIMCLVRCEDATGQAAMCTHSTTEFQPMTHSHYFQMLYLLEMVLTEEILLQCFPDKFAEWQSG
jgi:hypothetical protein